MRKVLPFIQPDYFDGVYKGLFKEVTKFVAKYNKLPSLESFKIEIDEANSLPDDQYRTALDLLPNIFTAESENLEWLCERTEKWCQDRAVYNAVMESISIIDGKHATMQKNAIPDVLSKALGVTFDTNIGHDYLHDVEKRYDFYHEQEERIPFDLDYFNQITKGGLPNKTLNIALAGTGVGKSLFMCHVAASALAEGRNALYITMEMAEERIAERIDANLLNVPIDQLENLSKTMFTDKVQQIQAKTQGKLIIKEYPTGQANTSHFRALLNEMKLKKNFVPEIIFVDYLNICTRSGYGNDDVGLEDTAESFGLPATADLMFALISTEELNNLGKIMVKQLKNRYNDPTRLNRFTIKVDRSKMRLEDDTDEEMIPNDPDKGWDDKPVFDNSSSGKRINQEQFKNFKLE